MKKLNHQLGLPARTESSRRLLARVAAAHLDTLTTTERIMVCEGIASLYPEQSSEAITAREHAEHLRTVERQQLLLTSLLNS
jgi:hypothetical protein